MSWLEFLGRFHPVILHLPIGLLIGAFGLEWMQRKWKNHSLDKAIQPLLFWGMITAFITALFGFFLHWEGGYQSNLLNLHKYLGIGTTVLAAFVYLVNTIGRKSRMYLPLFSITIFVLLLTGHYGGALTHGSSYLTDKLPSGLRKAFGMPAPSVETAESMSFNPEALVFQDVIQPIFRRKCTSCHNPEKAKGELLLHTQEGVAKGGKDGPLFVPGDVDNSILIQRLHLPLDNEDHMPPEGKIQLTDDEVALLEWWVQGHKSYDDRIQDVSIPENIESIFAKAKKVDNPVFALKLKDPGERRLNTLREQGVKVMRLAAENPLLEVNLSYNQNLDNDALKKLNPVSDQVVYLNLGKSNVTDEMLKSITKFSHLIRLYLDKTNVTDAGLSALQGLEYLEYLNLYGTSITDAALTGLSALPRLKELYLWQTQVSPDGVQALLKDRPELQVNLGLSEGNLGAIIPLQAPVIQVDQTLFTDSVNIQLVLNVEGANLYYTVDGTDPDSTSSLYSKPFTIYRTTEVRTLAAKPGWKTSPIGSKQLIRSKFKPQDIKLNNAPNAKYQASGPKTLIDFNKGSNQFGDGQWLGFEKQDVSATLDMGSASPVSTVTVSCLENASSWIFFPRGIQVAISADGKNWKQVQQSKYPEATGALAPTTRNFVITFPEATARFIKVSVTGQKTNPKWHPNPGEPCWLFMDEILVD